MSIFATFSLIFGVTVFLGGPMLSLLQFTQIHQRSLGEWFSTSLPVLIMVLVMWLVVMLIVRPWIKPLDKIVAKAAKEKITDEEKYSFVPALKKAEMVARIAIYLGFVIGTMAVVITKVSKGILTLGENKSSAFIAFMSILVTSLDQAILVVMYNTVFFETMIQKNIGKIGITDIGNIKPVKFTKNLSLIILLALLYVASFVAVVGYGPTRFQDQVFTVYDFSKNVLPVFAWCVIAITPIVLIMLKRLEKRFEETSAIISNIEKNGDLKTRVDLKSFDNLGQVNSDLNKLMESLNKTIKEVKDVNESVNTNAEDLLFNSQSNLTEIQQIDASFGDINSKNEERDRLLDNTQKNIIQLAEESGKISSLVEGQASAIEENASSITQMVSNINSVTEMVKKAKVLSDQLTGISSTGATEVKKSMELIQSITEKSQRMSEVTKVIQAVASQTNLLAMNAAIEAAHAGTAGAGFSVVADEIRKLAESTSVSTKEIKELIDDMITVVGTSSQSMKDTNTVFGQINQSVQEQAQIVETISNAMEEQSIGASETLKVTTEISNQITEINSYVHNQSEHNNQIKKDISEVVELSEAVNASLQESKTVIDNFEVAVQKICESAKENQSSVESVTNELNKFVL